MLTIETDFNKKRGFSLVEVIVAVGIFAFAIVGVIGLLVPTTRAVSDVRDSDDAARVLSALQARLQLMSFAQVTSLLKSAAEINADNADNYDPSVDSKILFASRGGDQLGLASETTVWSGATAPERDGVKFFEIALIRNDTATSLLSKGLSPKENDGKAPFLAFFVRLRWPAYQANGERFNANDQKSVAFYSIALTR